MTPFFSVIVPVYNMQCYLHECLQSIIDQSFSDFEIILVDNGSTDKSPEICRTYANQYPFVKVYVQPVAGVSAARNLGMSKCQGEYIVFVDSDDYLKANALRVLYDVITQENVDVLYYNLDVLENGAITPFDLAKEFKGTRTLSCNSAYRSILSNTGFRGYSCNKVFKRKKIEGLQFNINIHYLEDTLFNVEVIKLKPTIRTIDDSLYVYRQRGDSMSHGAFTLKKKTYLDALDVIQAEVPKALLPEIIRNRKLMS